MNGGQKMTRPEGRDVAAEATDARARFRTLPERIRLEDTFVSVPPAAPNPGLDTYSHDEWLTRNAWCGALI
jgi:hypothetical protein